MEKLIKLVEIVLSEYKLDFELCDSIDNTICIYDINDKDETHSFFLTISDNGNSNLMSIIGEYNNEHEKLSIYEKLNAINNSSPFVKVFIDADSNILATHEFVITKDMEALRQIVLTNILAYSQVTSTIHLD